MHKTLAASSALCCCCRRQLAATRRNRPPARSKVKAGWSSSDRVRAELVSRAEPVRPSKTLTAEATRIGLDLWLKTNPGH